MIATTLSRTLLRTASRAPTAVARAASRPLVTPFTRLTPHRAFSHTPLARGQGESDSELTAKLAQELSYEKENSNLFQGSSSPTAEPDFVTEFKQAGVWKITDTPGVDEVTLEREFGNEHISLVFSVGDIDTSGPINPDEDPDSPAALASEESESPQFPIRVSATITKADQEGALMLDGFMQDGEITVDNMAYYKSKELATKIDAEGDFERRAVYLGPQFETLDDQLQEQFHTFLLERGFDANLALFVPNYAEYKEQKEYCQWLENVRKFVEA